MATQPQTVLIGTFIDPAEARRFVEELKRAGFSDNQVALAGPKDDWSPTEEIATAGALSGALVGAVGVGLLPVAFPIVGGIVLLGALGGAAAGGLVGALVGWGVAEHQARHAEQQVFSGRTLVAVKGERIAEALAILERLGGSRLHAPGPDQGPPPTLEPMNEQPAG